MQVDLKGQLALVTGAAAGIGKACAERLVANRATVIVSDRDVGRARETAGNSGDVIALDVADRGSIERDVADVLARHGRIDILVNNAGIGVRAADRKTVDEFSIEAWDEMLAIELARDGIRVNAVAPGSTASEGWHRWMDDPDSESADLHSKLISHIPMGRPAGTQEIANGVLFLSSSAASYVTGHTLVVDGGWTAGFARDF